MENPQCFVQACLQKLNTQNQYEYSLLFNIRKLLWCNLMYHSNVSSQFRTPSI